MQCITKQKSAASTVARSKHRGRRSSSNKTMRRTESATGSDREAARFTAARRSRRRRSHSSSRKTRRCRIEPAAGFRRPNRVPSTHADNVFHGLPICRHCLVENDLNGTHDFQFECGSFTLEPSSRGSETWQIEVCTSEDSRLGHRTLAAGRGAPLRRWRARTFRF